MVSDSTIDLLQLLYFFVFKRLSPLLPTLFHSFVMPLIKTDKLNDIHSVFQFKNPCKRLIYAIYKGLIHNKYQLISCGCSDLILVPKT